MENLFNKLTTVNTEDGKTVSVAGNNYKTIISGKHTNNEYAVIDMLVPSLGGPDPHSHPDIQEAFYILDGEIEFTSEDGTYTAKKGSFVNIPKGGMIHQFKNLRKNLAHMICIVTPAGMEEMFEEIGTPVETNTFLPTPEINEETITKVSEVGEKYGQKFYPADYFKK